MACSLPYLVCPPLATGGYASWFTDADVFRPYVEWVARRHRLPAPGPLDAGVPGSHPVFVTGGGYVVKFYAPHWGEDARSERRVYRLLCAVEPSRIPRPAWRAAGVLFPGEDDWPWPYAVLGRVSGQPWSIVRDQMRRRDREYMAHRVGAMVRCLHDVDWHGRGQELAAQSSDRLLDRWRTAAARRASGAAWAHFDLGQAEDYLTRALSGMPAGVLTHGDITANHVFVAPGSSGPEITGLIDWADAEIQNAAYELVVLYAGLFAGESALLTAFRSAYGDGPLFQPGWESRATAFLLLFPYDHGPALSKTIPRWEQARTPAALEELLWRRDY